MPGVQGRVAFITGAGSGIGRTTAKVLSQGGADLVVCDINLAGAEATAHEATAAGRRAGLSCRCDEFG
jgi:NAD(P)-dependent dehydrogenase (short-subunit alcohol dehydrogenase family)